MIDIHTETETHAGHQCGFSISGFRSIFLLQTLLRPCREASDRQFRQWHIALNTNTALERGQRSRAEEITCDKLVMVPVVLCMCEWGHPPLPLLLQWCVWWSVWSLKVLSMSPACWKSEFQQDPPTYPHSSAASWETRGGSVSLDLVQEND